MEEGSNLTTTQAYGRIFHDTASFYRLYLSFPKVYQRFGYFPPYIVSIFNLGEYRIVWSIDCDRRVIHTMF